VNARTVTEPMNAEGWARRKRDGKDAGRRIEAAKVEG